MTEDFQGHPGRDCGEHRTTGRRAWCYDCTEWCYPQAPCTRCETPALRNLAQQLARLDATNTGNVTALIQQAQQITGDPIPPSHHNNPQGPSETPPGPTEQP